MTGQTSHFGCKAETKEMAALGSVVISTTMITCDKDSNKCVSQVEGTRMTYHFVNLLV